MTKNENLMVVAMEECAELSKAISKVLRFGLDEKGVNENEVWTEYNQLVAMMEMVTDAGILNPLDDEVVAKMKSQKKAKVEHFALVSEGLGRIKR